MRVTAETLTGSPFSVEVTTVDERTTYRPTADPVFLISAMGLAVLFALVVGASITHDFHMKILRWMRVTYRDRERQHVD